MITANELTGSVVEAYNTSYVYMDSWSRKWIHPNFEVGAGWTLAWMDELLDSVMAGISKYCTASDILEPTSNVRSLIIRDLLGVGQTGQVMDRIAVLNNTSDAIEELESALHAIVSVMLASMSTAMQGMRIDASWDRGNRVIKAHLH